MARVKKVLNVLNVQPLAEDKRKEREDAGWCLVQWWTGGLVKCKMATDWRPGKERSFSASPLEEGVALSLLSFSVFLSPPPPGKNSLPKAKAGKNPAWRPEKQTALGLGGPGLSGEQSHEVGPGRIPTAASTCHLPKKREKKNTNHQMHCTIH